MVVTCQWCKRPFDAKRKSAKFCSDSCRVASHRYNPLAIVNESESYVRHHIETMVKTLDSAGNLSPEVYEKLSDLENLINQARRAIYPNVVHEQNKRLL